MMVIIILVLLSLLVSSSGFKLIVNISDDRGRGLHLVARGRKGGYWVFEEQGSKGFVTRLEWVHKFPRQVKCFTPDHGFINVTLREYPTRTTIQLLNHLKHHSRATYDLIRAILVLSQNETVNKSNSWLYEILEPLPTAIQLFTINHLNHFTGFYLVDLLSDPQSKNKISEGSYQQRNAHGKYDTIKVRMQKSACQLTIYIA